MLNAGDRVQLPDGEVVEVLNAGPIWFSAFSGGPGGGVLTWRQDTPGLQRVGTVKAKTLAEDLKLSAGRKDDGGKAPWGLLMQGCALGLAGVVSVLKFGAQKYAAHSWQKVENAEQRYVDAMYRHLHSIELRGFMAVDPESGLLEWFHVACNALFLATFAAMKAVAHAGRDTH
jgi:hypothetical protein